MEELDAFWEPFLCAPDKCNYNARLLKAGAEMPMPQREAEKHRRLAATMGYEFYEMGFCTPMEEGGHRHMLWPFIQEVNNVPTGSVPTPKELL